MAEKAGGRDSCGLNSWVTTKRLRWVGCHKLRSQTCNIVVWTLEIYKLSMIGVQETNWICSKISDMNSLPILKSGKPSSCKDFGVAFIVRQTAQATRHRLQTYQRKVVCETHQDPFSTFGSLTCTPQLKSRKMQWETNFMHAWRLCLTHFQKTMSKYYWWILMRKSETKAGMGEPLEDTASISNAFITVND